ncbi:MAG: GNAT family N-acetyltransferase [Actinomycetota bacterium]
MPSFREEAVDQPAAHRLLTEYFHSRELGFIGGDYHTVFPSVSTFTDGVFLIVEHEGADVGCGGIRRLSPERMELKHLFMEPQTRGQGLGRALLTELERRAVELGATEMVLDTNATLETAANLYRSSGYAGIERYNDNPNATNWYLKTLR